MSQSDIQQEFENELAKSSWWRRALGSQFVAYLSLFISQIVDRVTRASERSLQESFLSLAINRRSILAGAEDVSYRARKISPSVGPVAITNTGESRLTLPALTQCVASNQMRYTIIDSVDLQPQETKEYEVQQFEVSTIEHTVTDSNSWLSILISQELTARTHNIIVRVNGEVWEYAYKFRGCTATSKAYMEYYKSTDQLGIRFGNGVAGMVPEVGDVITLELWLTEGVTTLMDGQKLDLVTTSTFDASNIDIEIKTAASVIGGLEGEDIESIRAGALYSTVYDEQIAWDGDYKTFIKQNIGGITWLRVWGEKEQEQLQGTYDLRNINKIFIAAYSPEKTDEELSEEILSLFEGREGWNESYETVDRKDETYTVQVTGTVLGGTSAADAEEAIATQLQELFGQSAERDKAPYQNDIWQAIQGLASSLEIVEFKVSYDNLKESVPIDTMHYLDLDNSTIHFEVQ